MLAGFIILLLDSKLSAFYSLPIFDTRLARLAIPVVVKTRSQCATSQCLLILSQFPSQIIKTPTQLPLTEVSTLLDQKISGNHLWH
jgi:hypothetical protein